ncbi:30S ribosome-binding factor RbfA [Cephaloticoccus primus]|uniref:30S ribosome-binding factor RbfA n=1 Tax=Cephaloticoccus primus TaxID=1548207 RepID=UPI000837EBB0|nr:30S ribosome-binding factor RbfA [Cephaloticoccus primus]
MPNRLLRVNALLQRELSGILHRRYQAETVTLTITEVRVSPDLRTARVYVSIVGSEEHAQGRMRWLARQAGEIRHALSRRVVLKYLPRLDYVLDASAERGTRIVQLLEELEAGAGGASANGGADHFTGSEDAGEGFDEAEDEAGAEDEAAPEGASAADNEERGAG